MFILGKELDFALRRDCRRGVGAVVLGSVLTLGVFVARALLWEVEVGAGVDADTPGDCEAALGFGGVAAPAAIFFARLLAFFFSITSFISPLAQRAVLTYDS